MRPRALPGLVTLLAIAAWPLPAARAQQPRSAWGRVSFFGNTASSTGTSGSSAAFSELIGTFTFESATGGTAPLEYRADLRLAGYPGMDNRARRVSIYDAFLGVRFAEGRAGLRLGQMWLNDLGGLGSVGGVSFEVRQPSRLESGRWRAGAFGGLEPKIMEAGYVEDVLKAGALVAYDGVGARRHVLGFVHVRDRGRTERSVLVTTNFLPVGKEFFLYQSAEYDIAGAGIEGAGSLTYWFTNARYSPTGRVELQGSYHRGRSIDSRTIIRDQLDGRPVDPRAVEGLRFESATGRVTVTVARGLRVFGGYGRDRNNREDSASGRVTYGFFAADAAGSGLDLSAADSRLQGADGRSFNSWYLSVGRTLARRLYLTGDYGSSLSVYRFVSASGFVIENRPRTRRAALSGLLTLPHGASVLTTLERVKDDDITQTRIMSGLSYRF
ncbi:MAG: hypothetical protein EHM24_22655 [Acidobacteria bacterium]|nr:MAG: hypothetical protein EHM24_22655 [Acidobacteriota bacterium]